TASSHLPVHNVTTAVCRNRPVHPPPETLFPCVWDESNRIRVGFFVFSRINRVFSCYLGLQSVVLQTLCTVCLCNFADGTIDRLPQPKEELTKTKTGQQQTLLPYMASSVGWKCA
ncbi:unnamed protein product, partial [Ectocarpus sp. 8 AP-2014]